jgi:hypothetical protein
MLPLTRNHVPAKYADPIERGDQLTTTHPLHTALEWLESGAQLLVLAGSVGTGKSLAAAKVLHDWRLASATLNPWGKLVPFDGRLWIAAPHLARLQPWADEVRELDDPGLLVLDDLGEEEATPKSLSTISTVLTSRFAEGRRTIVTTNLAQSTFRDRYGDRLVDRVRECGLDDQGKARWWITCDGESLRGKVEPLERPRADEEPPGPVVTPMAPEQIQEGTRSLLQALRGDA